MISKKAAGLAPYIAGEQPQDKKYIKLNTNESPYAPGDKVISALKNADFSRLRLYPDPASTALREAAAKNLGLKKENIFCGNGSDEILAFCFQAFFDPGGRDVFFPDITYSFYPVWCNLFGINYRTVPLKEGFIIDPDGYLSLANCQGIVIANPNAPTGRALPRDAIEKIVAANPGSAVIVDEAYVDFGAVSAVPLINKYPNLIVVRTFSKSYSLAGLRAGFAAGSLESVEALFRIKDSFNSYPLDMLAQAAAAAALSDVDFFKAQTNKIIRTRGEFTAALEAMGFNVTPSSANFVFASHPKITAEELYLRLKEAGVLVRWFNKPLINNYLRITIGADEEMRLCAGKIREILANINK